MPKYVLGSNVKLKMESPSPYRGCTGIVIKVIDHEFTAVYEIKLDSHPSYLPSSNRFLEEDLEPA